MARPKGKLSKLPNPRQSKFIEEYLKHGNASKAARDAGYSEKSANDLASRFLRGKSPNVTQALEKAATQSVTLAAYNADVAMNECESAILFAKETGNANAYVKAVELKSKLKGLLVEKVDMRQVGFQIQIGGITDKPEKVVESEVVATEPTVKEVDPFS